MPRRATWQVDDADSGYDGTDVEVSQLHLHSIITKEIVILVRGLLSWQRVPPNKYIVTFEVVVDDATTVQVIKATCDLGTGNTPHRGALLQ